MRAEADRLIRERSMQAMNLEEVDELLDQIFSID